MRARFLIPALLGLLLLAACSSPSTSASKGSTTTSTTAAPPSTTTTTTVAPPDKTAQLPDLVGKGLQVAQDSAQAAGFFSLSSHDASGRGRSQVLDRNWKVCFQQPAAGLLSTSTKVDFGAVELTEVCPATDLGTTPSSAAGTPPSVMPELVGKSVNVAKTALGSDASVTLVDATGKGRSVFLESNWQVCSQSPAAGQPYAGEPVTLNVVKFGETC
jgi:hypothetical protein